MPWPQTSHRKEESGRRVRPWACGAARVWHPPCLASSQVHPRLRFAMPLQRQPVQEQIGPQGQVGQPGGTWTCGGPRSVVERLHVETLPIGRAVRGYGRTGAEFAQENKILTSSSTNGCRPGRVPPARGWPSSDPD
jgi:hypothetical protein